MKFRIVNQQIKLGLKIEKEHDDITKGDPEMIMKIIMAHLKENPRYYTELAKMEKK
jgi:3-methyladenine DNA glycosylase AlkC